MTDRFREFYESVGARYPEDASVYRTLSGQIRKKWITRKLRELPAGTLLDCGCNMGTLSKDWHRGAVFGIDIAYAPLHRGRRRAPRTTFIQADLRDLSMLRNGCIDNAIACEVIEHLDRPGLFLGHLYRILTRGGNVLVTSPNFVHSRPREVGLGVLRSFGIDKGTADDRYLHTAYKPQELAAMAQEAGFTVLEQGSFEFELRGWLKPVTEIERIMNALIMDHAPASRLNRLREQGFRRLEIGLFCVLDIFNFGRLLSGIFKEGRRSYIVARK
ncbi:methyltransferase domain-containing protein [candidate division WOR-3 bacterium]|nr:methyltransferase domain-containing protein [candidate division WOR-3 bacterium]